MANVLLYRTYPVKDGDPVVGDCREALAKEDLIKKPAVMTRLSGLSYGTCYNIAKGKTRFPRYATVAALLGAIGYHLDFSRTGRFDLAAEQADAKRWNQRRDAMRLASKKGKRRNGKNENRAAL